MRPVQSFNYAYLEQSSKASPEQILEYLEQFRLMQAVSTEVPVKSKLISLKVAEDLLALFRTKCEIDGVRYQTQIKTLMSEWLGR